MAALVIIVERYLKYLAFGKRRLVIFVVRGDGVVGRVVVLRVNGET